MTTSPVDGLVRQPSHSTADADMRDLRMPPRESEKSEPLEPRGVVTEAMIHIACDAYNRHLRSNPAHKGTWYGAMQVALEAALAAPETSSPELDALRAEVARLTAILSAIAKAADAEGHDIDALPVVVGARIDDAYEREGDALNRAEAAELELRKLKDVAND